MLRWHSQPTTNAVPKPTIGMSWGMSDLSGVGIAVAGFHSGTASTTIASGNPNTKGATRFFNSVSNALSRNCLMRSDRSSSLTTSCRPASAVTYINSK